MSQFVDECALNLRAGDGGAGSVSFRREAHVPKGGPDGGDGGDGGNIWVEADHNVASLLSFRDHPHRKAENGTHGSGGKRHGKSTEDLIVKVPEGTTIYDFYTDEPLADLVSTGDKWLAVRAGRGGRGNAKFLTNRRRAPSFAEQGEDGEERWLRLELKLLADVALVGFPNAGKSTLISRISAAKPRIADYPFTTLEPNLGVVRPPGRSDFIVADIPGLIEGASAGKGLGHRFLRHIERARVLLIMLDLAPTAEHAPKEQLRILEQEIGTYRKELLTRPRIVVGSRSDVAEDQSFEGAQLSSFTGEGIEPVVHQIADLVEEIRNAVPARPSRIVHRPEPEDIKIQRSEDGVWEVIDRDVIRTVNLNDLTNPDALDYIHSRLKSMGVDRALNRIGIKENEIVRIGRLEFSYESE
ncbi:MAG TPA: GTPase ObgE [Acidimicrobiales bacterium]|nr:GTPase ObgE [Acidimicrobiales bacterium]